jgi:hypothetical protein
MGCVEFGRNVVCCFGSCAVFVCSVCSVCSLAAHSSKTLENSFAFHSSKNGRIIERGKISGGGAKKKKKSVGCFVAFFFFALFLFYLSALLG